VGVEQGGAVKTEIALAVGIPKGMGMGDNAQASIVTRGLAEITRLGLALGADAATFAGLAGVGDLVATCLSPLSRNRTFGEKLGQGQTVEEIVASTSQVAEGVKSAESILELARAHDVDMPIVEHVAAAVHDGLPPGEIVRRIMSRSPKAETE
jgi:glycerol-3-phosphate dehydrogenase (NAD(P)+)